MEIKNINIKKELFNILVFGDMPQNPTMAFDHRIFTINEMSLYVYPNDHNEPHFHIRTPNQTYRFTIKDCRPLESNNLSSNKMKLLKNWFNKDGKKFLVNSWNTYNPDKAFSNLE